MKEMQVQRRKRQALVPVVPMPQSSEEIRTYYSRKRKEAPEDENMNDDDEFGFSHLNDLLTSRETIMTTLQLPKNPTKKLKFQSSISSFFKSPHRPTTQLPTPDSSPSTSLSKSPPPPIAKQMTQLHLSNLGLATRTTIHCKTCQMQYNKIDPNDTKLHTQHHTSILQGPSFPKPHTSTRTLRSSPIPRIGELLVISRASTKDQQKRGLQLLSTIDIALGAPRDINRSTFFPRDGKIYAIFSTGRIISLVAAERIDHAYRRIPNDNAVETSLKKHMAVIGMSRMWTCVAERGKGWCTALLDECAAGFVYGADYRVDRGDTVAFTTPSESGLAVARKWTGRQDFLVYDG